MAGFHGFSLFAFHLFALNFAKFVTFLVCVTLLLSHESQFANFVKKIFVIIHSLGTTMLLVDSRLKNEVYVPYFLAEFGVS